MANSYGPSKNPMRCVGKPVLATSVRFHADPRTFDLVLMHDPNGEGHEQIVRMSRFEALCLLEAMRRVLTTPGNSSWNPDAIGDENMRGGADAITAEDAPFPAIER